MIQTIRVKTVKGPDLVGVGVLSDIKHFLKEDRIKKVQSVKVYRLEGVSKHQAKEFAEKLFCEKVNQTYSIDKPLINSTNKVVEIAYKPGVMNPEVGSILKSAKDLGIKLLAADTSREYGFYTTLPKEKVKNIINALNLYNTLTEQIVENPPTTLLIKGTPGKTATIPIRKMSDKKLFELSKDKLFLNLEEMQVIKRYFQKLKRDPTDLELETLAQTWSEHSGHKTFKAKITIVGKDLPAGRQEKEPLITRLKKEALKHKKHIVSAFVDNSGVMDFYDGWAICGKGETHNSPSAIEPYGGAMTGSGGVFRDIVGTGKGAKTIVSTDVFCLAPPSMDEKKLPPGSLSPRYLLKRVVTGVRDYGNRMGIPTNNGSLHFHDDFRAKPTVFVGAYGILPKNKAQKGVPKKGDIIVTIGGRVGRDGIHGATFSSGEMTDRTINVNASAVQIGNAIEEKRMFDAILEARDLNLIRAVQDSGGGGLSSAVGEIGSEMGVSVYLEKERLKYQGLAPWEIWVSESQERMVLAIPKNKLKKFKEICKKYNVEITELGLFDGSRKLNVYYGKLKVADLDMDFLHHGLPQRKMTARRPSSLDSSAKPQNDIRQPKNEQEWISILKKVVAHWNVNSKEPIVRLYDHSVQGTNDLQPYGGIHMDGPNDAVVIRPLLDKPYGMIVSHGLNPILNRIDPYWGSLWAGIEALSNYVAVGGDITQASLINNYIWPFPDEESLWSLDRSVDAVVDLMKTFKIPVISGKDSLSSTYRGKSGEIIKIPPVLCISVFGRIKDTSKTISADFKKIGSTIALVGKPDFEAMGGSVYYELKTLPAGRQGGKASEIPKVDIKGLPKTFGVMYKATQKSKLLSAHDISEGGLFTTVFEMCVGGDMGADIVSNTTRPDFFLFNETVGCFVVEVSDEKTAKQLFRNIPFKILGKTKQGKIITVKNTNKLLFNADIYELKRAWQKPMKELFP